MRSRSAPLRRFVALLALAGPATTQDLDLRLIPLRDGLRSESPKRDLARVAETQAAKEAAKVGLDLLQPAHPLVAHAFADGRLFYVFYKVTEEAFGDRPYLLQRIKKTERTWASADAEPSVAVTYQVEAFKTLAGALKGPDQHFGSYALRGAHRREVVKDYEIGFGEVPEVCAGTTWPFAANVLYHNLQPYGEAVGVYDQVAFARSQRWTLRVAMAKDGSYSVAAPELGIDAPRSLPDVATARPRPDPASTAIVLQPGRGPEGVEVGVSTIAAVRQRLGEPLEDVAVGTGSRNLSFAGAITVNFDASGVCNTVMTRARFAGRTANGIAHGMMRKDVRAKAGAPKTGADDSATWVYDGLVVAFDALDRVQRLVVTKQ